jgi:UDP-N-acetylmuramoyl-L-alanine---L-glutamate ligase
VATDAPSPNREAFQGGPPVRFVHGNETVEALADCQTVIRSPGISIYRPAVQQLRDAGVRLTTGTNLWMAEHAEARVVAITGTVGKSTTANLVASLAMSRGERVILAGNLGRPLLDHIAPSDMPDLWVLELSSYQAADIERSPRVAVVLNLYSDHVDWHGSADRYFADKLRLLRDRARVQAVLNARDDHLRHIDAPPNTTWFGCDGGYDAAGEDVAFRGEVVLRAGTWPLAGEHNALNLCAALTALSVLDSDGGGAWTGTKLAQALRDFRGLPHRLRTIAQLGKTRFVDDSISTAPEATQAAIKTFTGSQIALIAGGYDRGQRYDGLAEDILDADVVAVVGLPDTGSRLLQSVREAAGRRGLVPPKLVSVDGMDAAVHAAAMHLEGEGTVLLSPAAPSFNAFQDFEDRGRCYAAAVARTAGGRS